MILAVALVLASVAGVTQAQAQGHLQNLQQAHLPQDANVLAATQQFLQQFQALQARNTPAAPAPAASNQVPVQVSPHHKVALQLHNQNQLFQQAATAVPTTTTTTTTPTPFHNLPEEPINVAIRQLHQTLSRQSPNSNLILAIQPTQQTQQVQPFNQVQQQQQQQQLPTNHFQLNQVHQPNQQVQPQQQQQQQLQQLQQQQQQQLNLLNGIPIVNQFGHVINPNRFPGPLADSLPAAVNGPVAPVGPTMAVHQAQQQLAKAHMAILAHHATLPQTPAPATNNNKQG